MISFMLAAEKACSKQGIDQNPLHWLLQATTLFFGKGNESLLMKSTKPPMPKTISIPHPH